MKHNNPKDARPRLALTLSVCFHALLLLGAYYLPLRQLTGTSSGYSITLSPVWNRQEQAPKDTTTQVPAQPASKQAKVKPPTKAKQAAKPIQAEPAPQIPTEAAPEAPDQPDQDTTTAQLESPTQKSSEASTATNQEEETAATIDERGLYKTHQGKQTGALLELVGWVWDAAPQPQDDTDENGKIVFEIKIDELGEVITVKTLEKTISPLVEEIYKEALTKLTFTKTADNTVYAPISTGKVTFILQAK